MLKHADTLFDIMNPEPAADVAETFAPRPVVKQIAATSLSVYRELADTLPAREQAVLIGLRRFWAVHRVWPTAYELYRSMAEEGAAFDINAVRPRLHEAEKHDLVERYQKRICSITKRRVYTWKAK